MTRAVLQVRNLSVSYHTRRGPVQAVNDVSFDLYEGERFGLAGESGSGKSTMAMALLRMIKPPGSIEGGSVYLNGADLLNISEEEMRSYRWSHISLTPQGAMNSLNPVMRVYHQIADAIEAHEGGWSKSALKKRVAELLQWVGLDSRVADMYPHELSGGMKQRVCIAMAIALQPRVIIADEPTSALDVVVQRTVLQTLRAVQERLGAALIIIGHDMGLMAQFVDRLGIMYAGRLVEVESVRAMFKTPLHPYTQLLISSLPSTLEKKEFKGIPGLPPSLLDLPPGCAFHPRCPLAEPVCQEVVPPFNEIMPGRFVACHVVERNHHERQTT